MNARMKTTVCSWVLAAALVGGLASEAHAVDGVVLVGQANAIAGNVTPGDTPGFPVTISRPGSYRLTSNLTVPNLDTTAIHVTADNVTLDLTGFAILAPTVCIVPVWTPCPSDGRGVDALDRSNVAVLNGTVRGMGDQGVLVGPNGRVEKIRAVSNGSDGIGAFQGSIVTGNTALGNGRNGIAVGSKSTVTGNTARENSSTGISVSEGSTVTGNSAGENGGDGINVNRGSTVTGNAAQHNGGNGITTQIGSTVTGNAARSNGGFGLRLDFTGQAGYAHNVVSDNAGGTVSGGMSLGQNLCNGVLC